MCNDVFYSLDYGVHVAEWLKVLMFWIMETPRSITSKSNHWTKYKNLQAEYKKAFETS